MFAKVAFGAPELEEPPDGPGLFALSWEEQEVNARQAVSATAATREGRLGFGNMKETLPRMFGSPKR